MQPDDGALSEVSLRVLRLFGELGSETLDLHTILELAGGNDPAEREAVFDTVELLVARDMLAERGNDYYALTELGARVTTLQDEWRIPDPTPEPQSLAVRISLYLALATIVLFLFLAFQCS
jgi:hypothetical protein